MSNQQVIHNIILPSCDTVTLEKMLQLLQCHLCVKYLFTVQLLQ